MKHTITLKDIFQGESCVISSTTLASSTVIPNKKKLTCDVAVYDDGVTTVTYHVYSEYETVFFNITDAITEYNRR